MRKRYPRPFGLGLAAILAGCGGSGDAPPSPPGAEQQAATEQMREQLLHPKKTAQPVSPADQMRSQLLKQSQSK